MIHLVTVITTAAGFLCFCLSMQRHQRVWNKYNMAPPVWAPMRTMGACLLALAFLADVYFLGGLHGSVAWFGHLMIGAATIAASLYFLTEKTQKPHSR